MPLPSYSTLAETRQQKDLFHVTGEKLCADYPYIVPYPQCNYENDKQQSTCTVPDPLDGNVKCPVPNPFELGRKPVNCKNYSLSQLELYNCMKRGYNGRPVHFTYSNLSDCNWKNERCKNLTGSTPMVL